MFATLATFQPPMFSLKEGQLANSWYMLLTALVSQLVIGPYIDVVVNGRRIHMPTATVILAVVNAAPSSGAEDIACKPAVLLGRAVGAPLPAPATQNTGYAIWNGEPHLRDSAHFLSAVSEVASSNWEAKLVTRSTFHCDMSWLKLEAARNAACMLVTETVFQEPMLALKADADENISRMLVSFAMFHPPIGWLNSEALRNIPCAIMQRLTIAATASALAFEPQNRVLPGASMRIAPPCSRLWRRSSPRCSR